MFCGYYYVDRYERYIQTPAVNLYRAQGKKLSPQQWHMSRTFSYPKRCRNCDLPKFSNRSKCNWLKTLWSSWTGTFYIFIFNKSLKVNCATSTENSVILLEVALQIWTFFGCTMVSQSNGSFTSSSVWKILGSAVANIWNCLQIWKV